MALIQRSALCVLVLLGAAAFSAQGDGWQPLFNGTSLAGWRASENAGSWRVENGALVASGPRSHLFYVGSAQQPTFKNFELEAEVMTRPGSNSGIYFHTAFQESGWPSKGFEVQINNTHVGEGDYRERKKTGSLYGLRNVYGQLVADNEWFRMRIAVRGKQVQVWVNDLLTADYVEATPPAVDGDYKDHVLAEGAFALQGHDPKSRVAFRNLRVRRLPDDVKATAAAPVVDNTYRELLRLGGANFPVVDFHTHLKLGLTLDDVLLRWREQGIYAGVADERRPELPGEQRRRPRTRAARPEREAGVHGVPGGGTRVGAVVQPPTLEQFDYIFTDAMTWTDDQGKRMRLWIDREVPPIADPQEFMDMLVDTTVKIVNERADRHLRQPDVPARTSSRRSTTSCGRRTGCRRSSPRSGERRRHRDQQPVRIPSAAFIKLAKSAGVKFTCGTNNTGPKDLGRIEYCIQMIRDCGLSWQDMWVPPADGQKAIQRKPLIPSLP